MAYYDAFIAAWNNGATALPAGASGALFVAGDTTAQKLAKINAWTVQVQPPAIVPSYKVYDAVVPSEFQALTSANQQLVRDIWDQGTVDGSPGSNAAAVLGQVFVAGTTTRANLVALQNSFKTTVPWWSSTSPPYPRAFDLGDCAAAGVS